MQWNIHNCHGQRKYLTSSEVNMFMHAANACPVEVHSFCLMLTHSGCRISEALALTVGNIDFETGSVIIRCLKKRDETVFRTIPLPPSFLRMLRGFCRKHSHGRCRLWPWSRMTGYRRVRDIMEDAGIRGAHACPKGLRHAFGVRAIQAGVSLNLVQKWLGHADIKTTAIYTNAMGPEERDIAARMWRQSRPLEPARNASDSSGNVGTARDIVLRMPGRDNVLAHISDETRRQSRASYGKQDSAVSWRTVARFIGSIAPASGMASVDQIPTCTLIHFWI